VLLLPPGAALVLARTEAFVPPGRAALVVCRALAFPARAAVLITLGVAAALPLVRRLRAGGLAVDPA
jgi:hypothetical protein